MNDLATRLIRLADDMASAATHLRSAGKSIEYESHADELMAEAGTLYALAERIAAGKAGAR
jgi:hypothetical protein